MTGSREEHDLELAAKCPPPASPSSSSSEQDDEEEDQAVAAPAPAAVGGGWRAYRYKSSLLQKVRKAHEDAQVLQQWNLQEETNCRESLQAQHRAELYEELYPSRTWPHLCFHFVKLVTVASGLAMGLGQLLGMWLDQVGPIQYVLRVYMLAMCVLVVFNEMEWFAFTRDSKILRLWVSRGVVYSFVGVLGISENAVGVAMEALHQMQVQDHQLQNEFNAFDAQEPIMGDQVEKAVRVYVDIVAWAMVAMGILYLALGLLCCQIIYGRIQDDYDQRLNWAKRKRADILKKQHAENKAMQTAVDKEIAETTLLT